MNPWKPPVPTAAEETRPVVLAQADPGGWHAQAARWREHDAARLPWSTSVLDEFSWRMARHGLSVHRASMRGDRCYALAQLSAASDLPDDTLRLLATQLFRQFVTQRPGLPPMH